MNFKTKLTLIAISLFNITLFAQDGSTLAGTVVDADNIPVGGVTIVITNTTTGTATDFDGNYEIEVNDGDALQVSYIGYVTQTIPYTGQETLNVQSHLIQAAITYSQYLFLKYS